MRTPPRLRLRKARESDCRAVWEWIGDPEVRAAAFRPSAIPWETHRRWFRRKVQDPGSTYFIARTPGGRRVGQVRFERRGPRADVSILVAAAFRGKGCGSRLLALACARYFRSSDVAALDAYVKGSNKRSIGAFLSAGFAPRGKGRVKGRYASRLVLPRTDR